MINVLCRVRKRGGDDLDFTFDFISTGSLSFLRTYAEMEGATIGTKKTDERSGH